MRERRLKPTKMGPSSELPQDYLSQIEEVLTTHFDEQLKALKKCNYKCSIHASGEIYPEEVMLRVSLIPQKKLAATTFHASHDFDPKASSPKAEEVLSACVDILGSFMDSKLAVEDPAQLEAFVTTSLNEMTDVPFDWTPVKSGRFKVFLRFDRAHPGLDKMTEDWLKKNDPKYAEEEIESQAESAAINPFKDDGEGSGTVH